MSVESRRERQKEERKGEWYARNTEPPSAAVCVRACLRVCVARFVGSLAFAGRRRE